MSLSFSDRAVIRLPVVMMNGPRWIHFWGSSQQQPMSERPGDPRLPPQTPCCRGRASHGLARGNRAPVARGVHHRQVSKTAPSTDKPRPCSSPPHSHQPCSSLGLPPLWQHGGSAEPESPFLCCGARSCPSVPARGRGLQCGGHAALFAFVTSSRLERLWAALLLWLMLVWLITPTSSFFAFRAVNAVPEAGQWGSSVPPDDEGMLFLMSGFNCVWYQEGEACCYVKVLVAAFQRCSFAGCGRYLERCRSHWAQPWPGMTPCLQMFVVHKGHQRLACGD